MARVTPEFADRANWSARQPNTTMTDRTANKAEIKQAFRAWIDASKAWTELRHKTARVDGRPARRIRRALTTAEERLNRAADVYAQATGASRRAAPAERTTAKVPRDPLKS